MAFPVIVEDRQTWYGGLQSSGMEVQSWTGYFPGLNWDDFPRPYMLKDRPLGLPVHQNRGTRHLEHIMACMKMISRQAQAVE